MKKYGWLIAFVVVWVLVGYIYFNLSQHTCPYCHGKLSYQTKIIKDGETMFRYECENFPFHLVDSYIKF